MVIKHSEDKYADIHEKYRNMANELHDSWKHKYEILQRENEKLLNTLTFILNRNKQISASDLLTPKQNGQNHQNHIPSDSINNLSLIGDLGEALNEDVLSLMFGSGHGSRNHNEPRKSASSNSSASVSTSESNSQIYID